jgi:NAD-dependent SIR2 family protein deacetylase
MVMDERPREQRMREILLLGAGASVDAGVPDSDHLTEKIICAQEH